MAQKCKDVRLSIEISRKRHEGAGNYEQYILNFIAIVLVVVIATSEASATFGHANFSVFLTV